MSQRLSLVEQQRLVADHYEQTTGVHHLVESKSRSDSLSIVLVIVSVAVMIASVEDSLNHTHADRSVEHTLRGCSILLTVALLSVTFFACHPRCCGRSLAPCRCRSVDGLGLVDEDVEGRQCHSRHLPSPAGTASGTASGAGDLAGSFGLGGRGCG